MQGKVSMLVFRAIVFFGEMYVAVAVRALDVLERILLAAPGPMREVGVFIQPHPSKSI